MGGGLFQLLNHGAQKIIELCAQVEFVGRGFIDAAVRHAGGHALKIPLCFVEPLFQVFGILLRVLFLGVVGTGFDALIGLR